MNEGRPPALPIRNYASQPMSASRNEVRTPSGAVIHTRADGSRAEFHDARRGMDIHYGLNGNRRVVAERADHSRVFAERGGHDLIAVGTHGHRGFWRLLLGSCAETTIRHAPCSVLVVHAA